MMRHSDALAGSLATINLNQSDQYFMKDFKVSIYCFCSLALFSLASCGGCSTFIRELRGSPAVIYALATVPAAVIFIILLALRLRRLLSVSAISPWAAALIVGAIFIYIGCLEVFSKNISKKKGGT
ncbi:hypothetical protein EXE55_23650 [Burkholderia glumae]|nr:hypothetical protein EXE55_23650 [Burkholderia glumae]